MFDANMRYLVKGSEFFAEVDSMTDGVLHDVGVRRGDVILCEMLDDERNNPRVKFKLESRVITATHRECGRYSWIKYSGRPDYSGFINDESKRKALELMDAN